VGDAGRSRRRSRRIEKLTTGCHGEEVDVAGFSSVDVWTIDSEVEAMRRRPRSQGDEIFSG